MKNLNNKSKYFFTIAAIALSIFPLIVFGVGAATTDVSRLPLIPKEWLAFIDQKTATITQVKQFLKETKLDTLAFNLAQKASDKAVRSVIQWANNDFKGKAFYADDYLTILVDSRKLATIKQLTQLNNSNNPSKKQLMREIVNQYNNNILPSFRNNLIDKTLNSKEYQDFSGGQFAVKNAKDGKDGWNLLQQMTSGQGLNPLSQRLNAINQQNVDAEITKENTEKEKQASGGFADKKTCAEGVSEIKLADGTKYCPRYAVSTPGKLIESRLAKALDVPQDRLDKMDKWGQLLFESLSNLGDGISQVGLSKIQGLATKKINDFTEKITIDPSFLADDPDTKRPGISGGEFNLGQVDISIDIEKTLSGDPQNIIANPGVISRTKNIVELYKASVKKLTAFPQKIYKLDSCLPGPNYGWEERFNDKFRKASAKLTKRTNDDDPNQDDIDLLSSLESQKINFLQKVKLFNIAPEIIKINKGEPVGYSTTELFGITNNATPIYDPSKQTTEFVNASIPQHSEFSADIGYGIELRQSKPDLENKLKQKTVLKSQLEDLYQQWIRYKNTGAETLAKRKKLLAKYQLLTSEITNTDSDYEEAQQTSINIDDMDKKLDKDLTDCFKERRIVYPGRTFGDLYMGNKDFALTSIDMTSLTTMQSIDDALGPLKWLNPGGWLFAAGTDKTEDIFRHKMNASEKNDPEMSNFCNNFYYEVWDEDANTEETIGGQKKQTPALNMYGKTSGFLGFKFKRYKGVLCMDFYFGKKTDYDDQYR